MNPFRIDISDAEIDALHVRLDQARWPDQIGDQWLYGTDIEYLKTLCRYWRNEFDWRAQEAALNAFDQFTTEIDGESLHFIHQRSTHVEREELVEWSEPP